MMDFEDAAQRLARDQQKLRGKKTVAVSAKAKREADYRKKQQERIRQERQRQRLVEEYWQTYMTACDRGLGVKRLSLTPNELQLHPTSIHGEGDKIALPPSVLEFLTSSSQDDMAAASPWMFRIGILNPDYTFPQSVVLQTLKPPSEDHDEDDMDVSDEEHDHSNTATTKEAYLDELAHKYIAYTYGTVVEFTQDEGHVGLPLPIAAALLDKQHRSDAMKNFTIPLKRTQDPSGASGDSKENEQEEDDNADTDKTPGHVAYGAFDVPDMPVEITMVKLPKGKGCTLKPTLEAIQNGFYNLKDVKMVLEQSLIRTRATLSVGDTVQTWHRGVQYDLTVSKVLPATYHAVTCINTDIEVEFDQVENTSSDLMQRSSDEPTNVTTTTTTTTGTGQTLSGGRTLSSSPTPPAIAATTTPTAQSTPATTIELKPEPPAEQKEGICTVQIRGDGVEAKTARRRFEVQSATLQDLFDFASHLTGMDPALFRLVTRFPRKAYETGAMTMEEAGISPGQELFMIERV